MEIVWLGHSSLRLRSGQVTLITDPYSHSLGFPMMPQDADIVTMSNSHPHHSNCDAVGGNPRVLRGPGEYEIADFYINGMGTRLSGGEDEGDRQINTVFTIRAEGLTLCHLGDLNEALSPGKVQELNQTDVLFVPAGGKCTVSSTRIAALVNLIGPRIVIPLHYRVEGVEVDLEPLDGFLNEMGVSEASPQPRLNVTLSNLPRDRRIDVLRLTT